MRRAGRSGGNMQFAAYIAAGVLALGFGAATVDATVITGTYSFTASNFGPDPRVSVDPVTGSADVSFDTSVTGGVPVTSFTSNLPSVSAVSAQYFPITTGSELRVDYTLASGDYFEADFNFDNSPNSPPTPVTGSGGYVFPPSSEPPDVPAINFVASFTPAITPAPEPPSIVLLGVALGGIALVLRRGAGRPERTERRKVA
jgi:hypothetical protein